VHFARMDGGGGLNYFGGDAVLVRKICFSVLDCRSSRSKNSKNPEEAPAVSTSPKRGKKSSQEKRAFFPKV
jgi:hypothetical protein